MLSMLYIFSEQIYYAGPVNNLGFDVPQVRFGFSVLCCYVILCQKVNLQLLEEKKEEEEEDEDKDEEEEEKKKKRRNLLK